MNVEGKIAESVAAYNVELKELTKKLLLDVNQALKDQPDGQGKLKELEFDLVVDLKQVSTTICVNYMAVDDIRLAIRTRR